MTDLDLPVREELRRVYDRLYTARRERDEWRTLALDFKRQLNEYVREKRATIDHHPPAQSPDAAA